MVKERMIPGITRPLVSGLVIPGRVATIKTSRLLRSLVFFFLRIFANKLAYSTK